MIGSATADVTRQACLASAQRLASGRCVQPLVLCLLVSQPIASCEEAAMAEDRNQNSPNVDDEIGKAADEDVTSASNEDEFEDTEDLDEESEETEE
jgi:hypothetical protein